jgi:hypothetical protein
MLFVAVCRVYFLFTLCGCMSCIFPVYANRMLVVLNMKNRLVCDSVNYRSIKKLLYTAIIHMSVIRYVNNLQPAYTYSNLMWDVYMYICRVGPGPDGRGVWA